jgi:hypothetical protein
MYVWWRDIIREATFEGQHTFVVQQGLRQAQYLPTVNKDSNFSNLNKFILDFFIIEYHFQTAFKVMDLLRKTNIVAIFLFIRICYFVLSQPNGIHSEHFLWQSPVLIAVFFWNYF